VRLPVIAALGLLAACQLRASDEASRFRPAKDLSSELQLQKIAFATVQEEVLRPHGCMKCHGLDELASESALLASGWIVPGGPEISQIVEAVRSGYMPKAGSSWPAMTADRQDFLKAYIAGLGSGSPLVAPPAGPGANPGPPPPGANPPSTPPGATPPGTKLGFAQFREEILRPHGCLQCHGTEVLVDEATLLAAVDENGGKWADPANIEASAMLKRILDNSMPRGTRYPKLGAAQIERVREYLRGLSAPANPPVVTPTPAPSPPPVVVVPPTTPNPPPPVVVPPPVPTPVPPPTAPRFTFERLREEVLRPHGCIQCHGTEELVDEATMLAATDSKGAKWADAANAEASSMLIEILAGRMPRGTRFPKLDAAGVQKVRDYLRGLAPTPTPGPGPGPGPAPTPVPTPPASQPPTGPEPKFSWLKKNLFSKKCIVCHGPNGEMANFPLVTHEDFSRRRDRLIDARRPERSKLVEVLWGDDDLRLADFGARLMRRGRGGDDDRAVRDHREDDDLMPPPRSGLDRVSPEVIRAVEEWIRRGMPND